VSGNAQFASNVTVCGTETISSTAPSTGCTNGALVVAAVLELQVISMFVDLSVQVAVILLLLVLQDRPEQPDRKV